MKKILVIFLVFISAITLSSCSDEFGTNNDKQYFIDNYDSIEDMNHVFYKSSYEEIIEILDGTQKGTYLIWFGFPSCPWCQTFIKPLNDIAYDHAFNYLEEPHNKIYYYDIKEIRSNMSEEYLVLLDEIGYDRPESGEGISGISRISVPTIVAVTDGEVMTYEEGTILNNGGDVSGEPIIYRWDDSVVAFDDLDPESENYDTVINDLEEDLDIIFEILCGCQ